MENLGSESDDETMMCNEEMLNEVFSLPYHLEHQVPMSTDSCYILHMCGSSISNVKVAVALSDYSCTVYDVDRLDILQDLTGHTAPVSNIKFCPNDDSLLYTSSQDGTIKLWDLRLKNKSVKEFKDDSEGPNNLKPLSYFDISCNGKFLSAGTELVDDDAFILFWDARTEKLLGGYWESHMDVVTQVKFHPENQDTLATGSVDGLINVFDISKTREDDALKHTLNTESSVEKISWLSLNGNDILSCITQSQDLQLWQSDGAAPFVQFDRASVSGLSHMKADDDCYIVNVHKTNKADEFLLLAGNAGEKKQCLRTLRLHKKKLKPLSNLVGNKQLVRASYYDVNSEILVTGGEAGILSVWKPQIYTDKDSIIELKMESNKKLKQHRKKPY